MKKIKKKMGRPINRELDREVLRLRKKKLSFRQIAKLVNIDHASVSRRYYRALSELSTG